VFDATRHFCFGLAALLLAVSAVTAETADIATPARSHKSPVFLDRIQPWNSVFVVRAFRSGTSFAPQLALAVAAIVLAAWDSAARRRWDCPCVLLFGAATWTAVELTLHAAGMRVMPLRTLFGERLPLSATVLLQGIAEGGAIAAIGLFLGDRLLDRTTRWMAALGLAALCALVVLLAASSGDAGREVTSRRNLLAIPSILFCGCLLALDVLFVVRWPTWRPRAAAMFSVLVVLGTVWTIRTFAAGGRWIELEGTVPNVFERAGSLGQVCGLGYDIVVEIAVAYVAFLALPAMCGWISPGIRGSQSPSGSNVGRGHWHL
jgi:hypothetical protein